MELRQLEYFRVIAETESIHEAARRLNMSQPPLSYQLKQLETELNVILFERTRQGVRDGGRKTAVRPLRQPARVREIDGA